MPDDNDWTKNWQVGDLANIDAVLATFLWRLFPGLLWAKKGSALRPCQDLVQENTSRRASAYPADLTYGFMRVDTKQTSWLFGDIPSSPDTEDVSLARTQPQVLDQHRIVEVPSMYTK